MHIGTFSIIFGKTEIPIGTLISPSNPKIIEKVAVL